MSKSIAASLTSVSKTTLKDKFRNIDKSMAIALHEEMQKIKPKVEYEVEAFMQHSIYPTYREEDQKEMSWSRSYRFDKRKTGISFSLHIDHPLLIARETGRTVEGYTKWKPTEGRKFLVIDIERALLSPSLREYAQNRKAQIERSVQKKREAIYSETVSKPQQAVDKAKNLRGKRLSEIEPGERPISALFFRELNVGQEPFMDDLAGVMFRAVESKIDDIGRAAAAHLQELADGRNS